MAGLKGTCVIITGAGGGIGAALVQAFRDQGSIVIACDKAADTDEPIAPDHLEVFDLIAPASIGKAAENILAKFGAPDCLINNAGWTRAELLNVDATWCGGTTMLVTAGNAAASNLMTRLDSTTYNATTCGGGMPDGGPQHSLANRNLVRSWIDQGACP